MPGVVKRSSLPKSLKAQLAFSLTMPRSPLKALGLTQAETESEPASPRLRASRKPSEPLNSKHVFPE